MDSLILVVEDDATLAHEIERFVQRSALGTCLVASTDSEARAVLRSDRPITAIVVDVQLPAGCSGLDVLADARVNRHPTTPAVVVTGAPDHDRINRACALHALMLAKPFSLDQQLGPWLKASSSLAARLELVLRAWRIRYELSDADVDILRHAAQGRSRKQIAQARGTCERTVRNQITSLLLRLKPHMDVGSLPLAGVLLLREAGIA